MVAASLLALLLALLAMPIDIAFNVERREAFHSRVTVTWFFGLVRISMPGKPPKPAVKKPRKPTRAKTSRAPKAGVAKALLWNARFRHRLYSFIKEFFTSIHIVAFQLLIRLGLDDPADTGRLWACLGPLSVLLSGLSNATVSMEPDFQAETFFLDGHGEVRIVPLRVIVTVLAFVFSPITIRALVSALKENKR